MSGGIPCRCDERKKPIDQRAWVITQYHCNHSAFNGYHHTSSDYSGIQCERCRGVWRTKAAYVERLQLRPAPILSKETFQC
jgi:hypothetical protein